MRKIVVISICIAVLTTIFCIANAETKASTKGKEHPVERRVNDVVDDFTGISTSAGIKVIVDPTVNSIVIETSDNFIDYVYAKVEGNILKLGIDNVGQRLKRIRSEVKVFVPNKEYNILKASSGSSIQLPDNYKTSKLAVSVSSGSSIKGNIICGPLAIGASSGSSVRLSGRACNTKADASSGSSISCLDLKVCRAYCEASSGASIRLGVNKELSARVSSGASVRYSGEPALKDVNISSGGSLKKN